MTRIENIGIAAFALCLPACDGNSEDLRSLVGDGKVPVVSPRATETVRVTLANPNDVGSSNLDIVLTPDQKVVVKRYSVQWRD